MFGVVESLQIRPLDQAVDRLADDVAELEVGDPTGESAATALVELRRVRARLAAIEARLVERVDTDRPWAPRGYLTTAAWLAASDNTALGSARADVRLARRLRTMPHTAAALAAGDITVDHAHRLAVLNAPDVAAAFAEAEEFLVGQARALRWADFTKACEYWLRHARRDDPDPDKPDRDHRNVHLDDGMRGTGLLSGELTPTAKATVRTELERLEQQMFDADWAAAKAIHGDDTTVAHLTRTPRQRRHDALVEMARRSATAPANGRRPRPLLSVLIGEDAFRNVLELTDGTLISPHTVADLLDDAVIERIVYDGPSRIIDLGAQRTFVGAARRAVETIHRRCTGPGCHIRADQCEIDHLLPYDHGGPTHPDNGEPKCRPHHRQRQRPVPRPPRRPPLEAPPDGTDEPHHSDPLELWQRRIRDRILHDPAFGAIAPWWTDDEEREREEPPGQVPL